VHGDDHQEARLDQEMTSHEDHVEAGVAEAVVRDEVVQDILRIDQEENTKMVALHPLPRLPCLLRVRLKLLKKTDGAQFQSPRRTTVVATKPLAPLLLEGLCLDTLDMNYSGG